MNYHCMLFITLKNYKLLKIHFIDSQKAALIGKSGHNIYLVENEETR